MINAKGYIALSAAISILAMACQPHTREVMHAQIARDCADGREQRFYRFVRRLLPPVPSGTRREIRLETPFDSSNGSVNDYSWSVVMGRGEATPRVCELGGYVRFRADGYLDIFTVTKGSAFPGREMDDIRKGIARTGSADFSRSPAAYPPTDERALAAHVQQMLPGIEAVVGRPLGNPMFRFRSCAPARAPGVCEPQGTWEADYVTPEKVRPLHVLLELEPIHGQLVSVSVQ
jgi:hypothetical protein